MEIPHNSLSQEALTEVIKDFVLREGTDYGHRDFTTEEKTDQVLKQIKSGKAKIVFDNQTKTCSILETKY